MYAAVNGAELYYEVLGPEGAPAILTLHGGPGISDHRKAKEAFEPLTDEYRVVVYDHRGCGQSSLTPPYSNEQYARDAEALREHLGLGEVVLLGGSYGGFIAQEYATSIGTEDVAAIVLRDTAAHSGWEEQARETARGQWDELQRRAFDVPDVTWDEFERMMDGEMRSDAEFERVFHAVAPLYAPSFDEFDAEAAREATESRQFHHETHNTMFTEAYPGMDYREDLPGVDVPVLVTVGRGDWITPPGASEEIADLLPNARLEIFEDSGHSPNLDQQEEYIALVREFLDDVGFGG